MSSEEAIQEKNAGNEAYKKRDFNLAHQHYDRAIELDPTNITFYNNKAAAFFEEGKYDSCIELCTRAVDVAREHRADFQLVAKAYARIANAYLKKDDKKQALFYFAKSLSEHRDNEVVKKHKQLEKELAEEERKAYIDPAKSDEEKAKGNEHFQKGNYPTAIRHYSEALKRNPDNHVLYANRAACFLKLMEFQRAVDDCEQCIKKEPTFVKAYLRKGAALQAMHEYGRAQKAYEDVLMIDPSNHEAMEGLRACAVNNDPSSEKSREEALKDPEVQDILRDPSMRLLLEQMSADPNAAREHLKNPDIMQKLMKLKAAGIIGFK
ncbi:Stress-induced-phosphoprotein 1 [Aphelenchoides fujianensis]|nr:Stress-induced-phosphoprotein 1 [Aphelenchoides fujianensis]